MTGPLDFTRGAPEPQRPVQPRRGALLAKFDSRCPACDGEIIEGDELVMDERRHAYKHLDCDAPEILARDDGLIDLSRDGICGDCFLVHRGECL